MYDRVFPQPFYNREREMRELSAAWQAPTAQLVTVWERREPVRD